MLHRTVLVKAPVRNPCEQPQVLRAECSLTLNLAGSPQSVPVPQAKISSLGKLHSSVRNEEKRAEGGREWPAVAVVQETS